MLSPELPWVRVGSALYAQGGGTLDLTQLRFPAVAYEAQAAPNGAYVAYINNDGQLTVLDMGGSTLPLPEQAAGQPVRLHLFARQQHAGADDDRGRALAT